MRVKIYTVSHYVPEHYVATEIFTPFVTGQVIGPHPVFVSDEQGDNIAHENSYGEMRAQYYVWKNLLADHDYVGFQQYRRYFLFDQMPIACRDRLFVDVRRLYLADPLSASFESPVSGFQRYMQIHQHLSDADSKALRDMIGRHDILTVRPWRVPLAQHYRETHVAKDWEVLMQALERHSRFRTRPNFLSMELTIFYVCNMYIMRAELFDEYMSFWREAMLEVERVVKPHADPYQSRVYGFLSERLFTLFLYQLRVEQPLLHVAELPYLVGPRSR